MSTTPDPTDSPAPGETATGLVTFIAWSGVLLQLVLSLRLALRSGQTAADGLVSYFGYFTVLTNLFVALALSAVLREAARPKGRLLAHPQVLACAAVSIALVGLAYHVLLRHIWDPQGAQWLADVLLHYVTPLGFVLWWVARAPWPDLRWWSPLAWSMFPVAYLAYALARGVWLSRYPYPFIDVTALGYAQVMWNAMALLAVFLVLGGGLVGLKSLWRKFRS
jgi:hypothetical protein